MGGDKHTKFGRARLSSHARPRLLYAAALALCLLAGTALPLARRPRDFRVVYLTAAPDCMPVAHSAAAAARAPEDLLTFRLRAMDERTTADLFGREFGDRFFVYELCLARGLQPSATPPPTLYLLQDYLQIPVTLSTGSGDPLSPQAVSLLARRPDFKSSGLAEMEVAPARSTAACPCTQANALYSPASGDQLIEGKAYALPGGFEISRARRLRLGAFERRNVLTHLIKPLEKLAAGQEVERVLTVPQEETVGGQRLKLFPCTCYLRAGILTHP